MTKSIRRVHDAQFKTKVVLETLKGHKTIAQLSRLPSAPAPRWKRQALDGMPSLFESGTAKHRLTSDEREHIEGPLFQQIGQLKVENDWLKKKLRTN